MNRLDFLIDYLLSERDDLGKIEYLTKLTSSKGITNIADLTPVENDIYL